MSPGPWLLGIAASALAIWVALVFNGFVRARNRMREAFSGIDVQLRRRHDLVPNLVRVVERYAAHERAALEAATRARGVALDAEALTERERTEGGLSHSIDRLIALVEAYPDLKADGGFLQLQRDLVEVEADIQYARRYYNGAVRDHNNRIEQFPANLLAPMFRVSAGEFFELESPAERGAPVVRLESP